jgi:hypothetical protein
MELINTPSSVVMFCTSIHQDFKNICVKVVYVQGYSLGKASELTIIKSRDNLLTKMKICDFDPMPAIPFCNVSLNMCFHMLYGRIMCFPHTLVVCFGII